MDRLAWTGYVYSISHPETKEVIYIGQTQDIAKRIMCHINKHHNQKVENWINDLLQIGKLPIFKIEWMGDFKLSLIKEKEFIEKHIETVYNTNKGVGSKSVKPC